MKKKFVDNLTNFVIKNKHCDERQIKIIRYGLEGLYMSITKFIVVIILVILLDSLKEFLLLFISYVFIRRYSFGLHANSSIVCWLITVPIYIGGSLIIKFYEIPIFISYIICSISYGNKLP